MSVSAIFHSGLNKQNWYPLLKRKWAIVFAMVRGGGDIDAAWAEMARRNNRHLSVDDFESVIRDSKKKLKLGPDKTVIYGRSAGGLPVGAIVSRYPNGELVGAAFNKALINKVSEPIAANAGVISVSVNGIAAKQADQDPSFFKDELLERTRGMMFRSASSFKKIAKIEDNRFKIY